MTTKICYHHFHDGNDPDHTVRGPAVYATQAKLVDLDTGNVLVEEWAYCSPNDSPSRAVGREVSRGRLQKKLDAAKEKERVRIASVDEFLIRKDNPLRVLL